MTLSRTSSYLLSALAILIIQNVSRADTFRSPDSYLYYSQDSSHALQTIPAEYWRIPPVLAMAVELKRSAHGKYNEIRRFNLVNPWSPVAALISNDGRHVVTFDDWGQVGYGENAIVIYAPDDSVIRRYAAEDFIPSKWLHMSSVSTRRWGKGHRLDERSGQIIVHVFGASDSVHIDLVRGRILSPDWAIMPPRPKHHPTALWERQVGRNDHRRGEGLLMYQPEDSSVLVALGGTINSGPSNVCNVTLQLSCVDRENDHQLWGHEYLQAHTIRPRTICRLMDTGYALALRAWSGCSKSPSSFNRLMRFTHSGELVWSCQIGSEEDAEPYTVLQSRDGTLVVAGRETAQMDKPLLGRAVANRLFIERVSEQGHSLWRHEIRYVPFEVTCNIAEIDDGRLILAFDHEIRCLNANGDSLWSSKVRSVVTSMLKTTEESIVLTGYGTGPAIDSSYYNNGEYVIVASRRPPLQKLFIGEIGYDGHVHSEKYVGQTDTDLQGLAITSTSDGGLMIGGTSKTGSSFPDAFLVEINANGDTVRSWTFGSAWADEIRDVREISPGYFVASGNYVGSPFIFEFSAP